MTNYEHLVGRAEYCEEQARLTRDSYMKTFWAKTADHYYSMARRLSVETAEREYEKVEHSIHAI